MTDASSDHAASLLADLWADLDGPADLSAAVGVTGPVGVLPSIHDVTGFAAAACGAAALAIAELGAARRGAAVAEVSVDRLAASASFACERLLQPVGWELPPVWDPIAGDYLAADGWIRLHTNYGNHRAAALSVLRCPPERDAVGTEVATWKADDLEAAVVAAGGAAAAMHTIAEWAASEPGRATATERPVGVVGEGRTAAPLPALAADALPLAGVRTLDLTRVIAGPTATRYLAAYGADVVRIDPPGFEEVPALLPETTAGKACAFLDFGSADGHAQVERLLGEADVLVCGLRPDALDRWGWGAAELAERFPGLIQVRHSAYGWSGPWAGRRGFDSLVQMSTGIAAAGADAAGADRPTPLPVQALDHGLGHLLAAAVARALTRRILEGAATDVRGSLVGTANVLRSIPFVEGDGVATIADAPLEPGDTAWGPLRRAPLAGRIEGATPSWSSPAAPLGDDAPSFAG